MTITDRPTSPIDAEHLAALARTLEEMRAKRIPPSSSDDIGERRHDAHTRAIDAALARIEDGTFGYCRWCRGTVPLHRLEVVPTAQACLTCAAEPSR